MFTLQYKIKIKFITVFLSGFGAFLRSEIKFSKLLIQLPHQLVNCAHHKSSFSYFCTICNCFGTFMQLIKYICLQTPTLSVANLMLLKMYHIVLCATFIKCKMVDLAVINCHAHFLHISIRVFVNLQWIFAGESWLSLMKRM